MNFYTGNSKDSNEQNGNSLFDLNIQSLVLKSERNKFRFIYMSSVHHPNPLVKSQSHDHL